MQQSLQKCSNFLFWVKYDGSYFAEMAKGKTRRSVVDWLELVISHCTGSNLDDMNVYPTSRLFFIKKKIYLFYYFFFFRTDKFVHAVRSPFLIRLPSNYESIKETNNKNKLLLNLNHLSQNAINNSLNFLDINFVSPYFHPRKDVSYRFNCKINKKNN